MTQPNSPLDSQQIEAQLGRLPDWTLNGVTLHRTFGFENFIEAMGFVNRVAELAESHQHHPDIMIRYGKVTLTLSTHDAGGITDKDFALARATDEIVPVR
jgi:4a-hydroxytetrahydrobiopterin dehydratase